MRYIKSEKYDTPLIRKRMTNSICLVTKRLRIRDPQIFDLPGWHKMMSDAETMYYLADIMTHSEDENLAGLKAAITDAHNRDRVKYFFAIETINSGVFIGSAGYTVKTVTPLGKVVEAGYFILPDFWRNGYATEALKDIIRFAFEEDGVFRIETGCYSENKASERVMRKCGMVKEAEYKQCVWHDGKMKDRVSYRLLKTEYVQTTGAARRLPCPV
jgi:ribosomal-protein-alanine N-acetyltransferase